MGKPREPHGSCGGQCGGSCIRVFWPACRIAGKLLAASPGAFCLQTKEVSGNNRVSPPCLAFLLGAAPGSRPVPQAPQVHAQLQAAPQNYLVLRGYTVVTSSLCHFLYNKPKRRLYREGQRVPWRLWEFFGIREAGKHYCLCLCPPP